MFRKTKEEVFSYGDRTLIRRQDFGAHAGSQTKWFEVTPDGLEQEITDWNRLKYIKRDYLRVLKAERAIFHMVNPS